MDYNCKFFDDLAGKTIGIQADKFQKMLSNLSKYNGCFTRISDSYYDNLGEAEQSLFIEWFVLRWLGVNILDEERLNKYDSDVRKMLEAPRIRVKIGDKEYLRRPMKDQGQDFDLIGYEWFSGIHDIYYDQYEFGPVKVSAGDTVIDAGAFIGDTAVLFDAKSEGTCDIHSFELLDENIAIINENLRINDVKSHVTINKRAVSDKHNESISIDFGAPRFLTTFSSAPRRDRLEFGLRPLTGGLLAGFVSVAWFIAPGPRRFAA